MIDTSVPASSAQCLPFMCGMPTSPTILLWCAESGHVGALSCGDPQCAPWSDLVGCPAPVLAAPPVPITLPPLPALTPANIVQPLPDISAAVAPVPIDLCNWWSELNGWIAAHPETALFILAGATALLWRRK